MAEDGEDWRGLEMTILKSLAKFFKMHERWRSSFNTKVVISVPTRLNTPGVYFKLGIVEPCVYLTPEICLCSLFMKERFSLINFLQT